LAKEGMQVDAVGFDNKNNLIIDAKYK